MLKNKLQDKWNDLVSTRKYIAVCEGIFERKQGTIKQYLKENPFMSYTTSDLKITAKNLPEKGKF